MENNCLWNPLAVLLSMYGSKISSKLLFKYPYEALRYGQPLSNYHQVTSSVCHLNQTNSSGSKLNDTNCENENNDDLIRDEVDQFLSFSDDILAQILCPGNSKSCGQKFDVKINGLRFAGFPLMLEHNNVESNLLSLGSFSNIEKQQNVNSSATDIFVMSYNIVFVLKTTANYPVVESYQQLAAKFGIGLRYEEKRDNFLTRETKLMLNIHDEDTDLSSEEIFGKILDKSSLANNLRQAFEALQETGIIDLQLNNNLRISYCLYHKIHNVCFDSGKQLDVFTIENCLKNIKPFHGILVYDINDVWNSLTASCSRSIVRFLKVYQPTKSLHALAIDGDIALNQVYTITRHLVMWGKACIIYPLCETNVYVLAPTASLYNQSKFVKQFADRFQLSLTEILAYFSTPVSLADHQSPTGPFYGNPKTLVDILMWMLQHRFLIQHHTYVYFMPPGQTDDQIINKIYDNLLKVEGKCLEELPKNCQNMFRTIEAAHSRENLFLFSKLLKYLDGKHHLEEIMYRENMARFKLINLLDKFKSLLITCVREDQIASAFCVPP